MLTLLVPVDGSPGSDRAVELVIKLHRDVTPVRIRLLHVLPPNDGIAVDSTRPLVASDKDPLIGPDEEPADGKLALSSARALHSESIEVRLELGHRQGIAESLDGFASVALALACPLRAACIWGAAERLRSELGSPLRSGERRRYDDRVRAARAACGNDTAFDAAWREGGAMNLEQAIAYAEQADSG